MALKMNKDERKRLSAIAADLGPLRGAAEDAIRVYNEAVLAARVSLDEALDSYREQADAAFAIFDDLKRDAEETIDGKSEKWRDSYAGAMAREWVDALDEAMGKLESAIEIESPEQLSEEAVFLYDLSVVIEAVPAEPQGE